MTKFVMLIRNEGDPMIGLTEEERGAVMESWGAYMSGLGESLVDGLPFGDGSIVSGSGVTKGRHEEGNINVGGYLIVNADSMDQAVEMARKCPAVQNPTTTLEVRECLPM